MSNDVKVTQEDVDAVKAILAATSFSRDGAPVTTTACEVAARHRIRHQPQEREAVLEQALLQCASRFSAYAELHAEKLWDGSLSEAQRQTVRDKVDRNLRYAAEARAALTTPAPSSEREAVSKTLVQLLRQFVHLTDYYGYEGAKGTASEAREYLAALTAPAPAVSRDDQALLADIFDNMAEVLKPLPGIPDAPGQHAGTRATESGEGDKR